MVEKKSIPAVAYILFGVVVVAVVCILLGVIILAGPFGSSSITSYPVVVNYDLSLVEMVEAGDYGHYSSNIFEFEREVIEGEPEGEGKQKVHLELVCFSEDLSTEQALERLDGMSYRPATFEELLAFGAKYPKKQDKFLIAALGTVWRDPSGRYRYVAYIYAYGFPDERIRALVFSEADGDWDYDNRFLVVPKNP